MVPNYSEEEATQPMLLERVLPSPGLLRMKKIRLWVATIIVLTVVGALFLLTSSKIHSQSKAYMSWQYKVKDTKVKDRPLYSEGGSNEFIGINETEPHGPKLINVKHISKSRHDGESSDDDFLVFEATVDILDNKMHYREASNGWVPKLNVLLFHGQHYTSAIWNDIGALDDLAGLGYRVVALELPGHGLSQGDPTLRAAEFIKLFIQHLDLYKPGVVLVSADDANTATMEYLIRYSKSSPLLRGYINIDSAMGQYTDMQRITAQSVKTQVLFLCGGTDTECLTTSHDWSRYMASSRVHSFSNAYREFYNEDPVVFNTILKRFLEYLAKSTGTV